MFSPYLLRTCRWSYHNRRMQPTQEATFLCQSKGLSYCSSWSTQSGNENFVAWNYSFRTVVSRRIETMLSNISRQSQSVLHSPGHIQIPTTYNIPLHSAKRGKRISVSRRGPSKAEMVLSTYLKSVTRPRKLQIIGPETMGE